MATDCTHKRFEQVQEISEKILAHTKASTPLLTTFGVRIKIEGLFIEGFHMNSVEVLA